MHGVRTVHLQVPVPFLAFRHTYTMIRMRTGHLSHKHGLTGVQVPDCFCELITNEHGVQFSFDLQGVQQ